MARAVLRDYGVSVLISDNLARIVPNEALLSQSPTVIRGRSTTAIAESLRPIYQYLPLVNVSANDMAGWLQTAFGTKVRVSPAPQANAILLLGLPDDAPAVTFMHGAATVHFWRRRMALETMVHRTDAELATGVVTPMDDALSADGVNELLWFGSHPENDHADGIEAESVVSLTDGPRTWTAVLTDGALTFEADRPPDATVRGSAPALLLALSGRDLEALGPDRFGVVPPVVEGDAAAYQRLRTRLGDF